MSNDSQWHLNKSVPISLLFAIFLQTATGIWWASGMNSKVINMEDHLRTLSQDLASENLRQWARINASEELVKETISQGRVNTAILERVENRVDSLTESIEETNELLREIYRN